MQLTELLENGFAISETLVDLWELEDNTVERFHCGAFGLPALHGFFDLGL